MALQSIVLPLVSVFRSVGFNEALRALKGLDGGFKSVAKNAGMAAAAFAAATVIQNVTRFVDEAVVVTQKYERNMLALNQVFEGQSTAMRRFTEDAQQMGISQGQAAQAGVFLGSVLKQYGLDQATTARETQKLISLSQDLATTYGYDLQEALLAMTALFRGEYDPIEKFGVAMKQSEINALLASRGQDKLTGSLLFQAQVQARLDLLYQRSTDAVGAFERAQGTLYVSQQKLNASLENMQIAFGTGLQEPIARVTDLFAGLVADSTDFMGRLGQATGNLIVLLTGLVDILIKLANPVLDVASGALEIFNNFFIATKLRVEAAARELDKFLGLAKDKGLEEWFSRWGQDTTIERFFSTINRGLENSIYMFRANKGDIEGFDNGVKAVSVSLRRTGYAAREAAKDAENTATAGEKLEAALRAAGTAADDASGSVSTLSTVFSEIDTAIAQSNAKQSMEDLGLSAGLIEKVLTDPDWENIFRAISRYAQLAAIDISKVMSVTAAAALWNERKDLEDFLANAFTIDTGKASETTKKSVETIFDVLREETSKQRARLQLEQRGASEGLINLILGRDDWMNLWIQIKQGVVSLEDLQKSFNKTADGAKELADAAQAAADKLAEQQKAAYDLFVQQQEAIGAQVEAIRAIGEELKKTAILDMLPSTEEIGKYEQSVVDQFANIKASIKDAFDNKAITDSGLATLMNYANAEQAVLRSLARQRDDMMTRYDLAKALMAEYRSVFSTSMNLVNMLNQIEEKTQKVTVTETSTGIVTLSDSLKEFQVTLSRTYDETIKTATDPSQAVLDGFRAMAQKARDFAANLKKLEEMNLDPMLFDQLVKAGVEAGGATAQALVDGGQDTITEVSDLFREIDALGGKLGEEVATGLYGEGIDMANGLLEGLLSAAAGFEQAGIDLADAFTTKFAKKVDAAIQDAINKLNNLPLGQATGNIVSTDSTGMPQAYAGAAINTPKMPTAIVTPAPVSTSPTIMTTTNVYASSYYGGYTAAQGATASQSRIATNNGGISKFLYI